VEERRLEGGRLPHRNAAGTAHRAARWRHAKRRACRIRALRRAALSCAARAGAFAPRCCCGARCAALRRAAMCCMALGVSALGLACGMRIGFLSDAYAPYIFSYIQLVGTGYSLQVSRTLSFCQWTYLYRTASWWIIKTVLCGVMNISNYLSRPAYERWLSL